MSVQLNHTIVWCRDKRRSADFLVQLLGLPPPTPFGPMLVVQLDNGVSLDYYDNDPPIASQHYAFLVAADDFEPILQRIRQRGLAFWADPGKQRPNEINRHESARRVYFDDPDGHLLEVFSQT
ncbi:VOC family protein [Pseudomonas sp. T8]|uniref:VOC family protein n=1 Tax=Pseudomonas sp. T8 TaxID=645292 RepID=UPI002148F3C9|nr:VOC family protein [Pseudomonas sp. T8]UUT23868.1 VOC family protein [Pseudomonas sp. T8]